MKSRMGFVVSALVLAGSTVLLAWQGGLYLWGSESIEASALSTLYIVLGILGVLVGLILFAIHRTLASQAAEDALKASQPRASRPPAPSKKPDPGTSGPAIKKAA